MGILDDLKTMAMAFQEAGKMELYEKISKLLKEREALEKEVSKLKKKIEFKESMIFENRAYWIKDKNGNVKDGPFCPTCWDSEKLQNAHNWIYGRSWG